MLIEQRIVNIRGRGDEIDQQAQERDAVQRGISPKRGLAGR
jgi:hypothetical protein